MAGRRPGKFGKTAITALAFQGVSMFLSISWVYVVTRSLGVAATGQIFVALAIVNTSIAVFSFGLAHAIPVRSRDLDDVTIASNGYACTVLTGSLAAACLWLVPIAAIHGSAFRYHGVMLLPAIVFFYVVQIMGTVTLRAVSRFRIANWCAISVFGLFNLLLAAMWFSRRGATDTSDVLFAFMLSCIGGATLVTVPLALNVGLSVRHVSWGRMHGLLFFGGVVQVGNVLKEVMYRADLYLVGWLLGSVAAGFYSVILRVIEAIARFVDAIGVIAVPMIARGTAEERARITYLSLLVSIPIMTITALAASLLARPVVLLLFGAPFLPSTDLLRIGVFALVPLTVWKILANDVIARGMARAYIVSALTGALTITGLNAVLLPAIGIVAAPIVLNIAYLLAAMVLTVIAFRCIGYRPGAMIGTAKKLMGCDSPSLPDGHRKVWR